MGGDNARSDRVTPTQPERTPQSPAPKAGIRHQPVCDGRFQMQTVVIVIHLMIVAVLIGTVLLQKSEGGGLGMGGGAGFMSSRGTANLLSRTTAVLAAGFFLTSLFLSWLASYDRKPTSIIGGEPASQSQPAGPATPISPPQGGGVFDSLRKSDERQQTPTEPAGPQAPRSQ